MRRAHAPVAYENPRPVFPPAVSFDGYHRGRAPGEGSIGFRLGYRDRVDRDMKLLNIGHCWHPRNRPALPGAQCPD